MRSSPDTIFLIVAILQFPAKRLLRKLLFFALIILLQNCNRTVGCNRIPVQADSYIGGSHLSATFTNYNIDYNHYTDNDLPSKVKDFQNGGIFLTYKIMSLLAGDIFAYLRYFLGSDD